MYIFYHDVLQCLAKTAFKKQEVKAYSLTLVLLQKKEKHERMKMEKLNQELEVFQVETLNDFKVL